MPVINAIISLSNQSFRGVLRLYFDQFQIFSQLIESSKYLFTVTVSVFGGHKCITIMEAFPAKQIL